MPTKKRPARKTKRKAPKKKQNGAGYANDAWGYVKDNKGKIATGLLLGGVGMLGTTIHSRRNGFLNEVRNEPEYIEQFGGMSKKKMAALGAAAAWVGLGVSPMVINAINSYTGQGAYGPGTILQYQY